jgi:hypothetical protein
MFPELFNLVWEANRASRRDARLARLCGCGKAPFTFVLSRFALDLVI